MTEQSFSSVADKLRPYIVQIVREILRTSGTSNGSGSSGSGAVTVHGLNSTLHSGTLSDAQGPQFLKSDGSRTLSGNLVVATSVTIDGVDISAHAANPAAHHALVTGGNGIEVSVGQVVGLDLATDPGLEFYLGTQKK